MFKRLQLIFLGELFQRFFFQRSLIACDTINNFRLENKKSPVDPRIFPFGLLLEAVNVTVSMNI